MSKYLWCLHCERVYVAGSFRNGRGAWRGLRLCPYDDCDGSVFADSFPWAGIRAGVPEYPVEPERGVMYPNFGRCEYPRLTPSCPDCFYAAKCMPLFKGVILIAV